MSELSKGLSIDFGRFSENRLVSGGVVLFFRLCERPYGKMCTSPQLFLSPQGSGGQKRPKIGPGFDPQFWPLFDQKRVQIYPPSRIIPRRQKRRWHVRSINSKNWLISLIEDQWHVGRWSEDHRRWSKIILRGCWSRARPKVIKNSTKGFVPHHTPRQPPRPSWKFNEGVGLSLKTPKIGRNLSWAITPIFGVIHLQPFY